MAKEKFLPTLQALAPFEKVGFYEFYNAKQCIFKGCEKNLKLEGGSLNESISRSTLIGRFYHQVMEEVGKVESLEDLHLRVEELILDYQQLLNSNPNLVSSGSFSGWKEVNTAAKRAYQRYKNKDNVQKAVIAEAEKLLVSKDGCFIGRPDYFTISGDCCNLVELKSTSIRDNRGEIKEDYNQQLLFYSFLIFDNYPIESVNAKLQSLLGDSESLTISKDEAHKYFQESIASLKSMNNLINKISDLNIENITAPGIQQCQYCNKKIICSSFKKSQFNLQLQGATYVIEGILKAHNKLSQSTDSLEIFDINLKSQTKVVLNGKSTLPVSIGGKYLIDNLKFEDNIFRGTKLTEIYSCHD